MEKEKGRNLWKKERETIIKKTKEKENQDKMIDPNTFRWIFKDAI